MTWREVFIYLRIFSSVLYFYLFVYLYFKCICYVIQYFFISCLCIFLSKEKLRLMNFILVWGSYILLKTIMKRDLLFYNYSIITINYCLINYSWTISSRLRSWFMLHEFFISMYKLFFELNNNLRINFKYQNILHKYSFHSFF